MGLPICSSLGAQVPLALSGVVVLCETLLDAHVALDNVARALVYDSVPIQCETVRADTPSLLISVLAKDVSR